MEHPVRPFPFKTELSLRHLIAHWEEAARDAASPLHPLAPVVLDRLEAAPALRADALDPEILAAHRDALDLLLSAVVARSQWERQLAALMAPFAAHIVYATPAAERLGLFDPDAFHVRMNLDRAAFEHGRTMLAYFSLLKHCYGVDVGHVFRLVLTVPDPDTGLERHFKLAIDAPFSSVEVDGEPPALSPADLDRLVSEPTHRGLWEALLPPERFTFRGFGVLWAHDVTEQMVLSALKDDLLQRAAMTSAESVAMIQGRLRSLIGCPDLELGLICLEEGELNPAALEGDVPRVRAVGRSLLLDGDEAPCCPHMGRSTYARALAECAPVVVSNLCCLEDPTAYEEHLLARGFRSLLVAPLRVHDRAVGLLEVASPTAGALNAFNTMCVPEVAGLFATALRRSLDEREDRMQALIKAQCTAIHPVVEWRFREAAARYLETPAERRPRQLEPIVFPDVYPLYGLSDIRNSSTLRAEAIATDLAEQLSLALSALVEATAYRPLPGLDELGFRIQRYVREIELGLSSEHEGGVLDFLRRDVEPLFDHLATYGPRVADRIAAYRDALDPGTGMVYRERKRYEDSVTLVNEAISTHLEAQEAHAQALTPHYFEKYKTDGVDHTLYVGPALLRDPSWFDPLSLRNLRLWQLMTVCGIAWALERLAPALPLPLETAHLVLAHDDPLAIRFRYDEKQFDVDGAYNTRYAIVKKRVDKAYVAGTEERLTQPGTLAIVFTQARAAHEYRTYIDYLQDAGFLGGPVQQVDLEPMPGAAGLHAFRVPIAPEPPGLELEVTPERTLSVIRGA